MQLIGISSTAWRGPRKVLFATGFLLSCAGTAISNKAAQPSAPAPNVAGASLPDQLRSRFEEWKATNSSLVVAGLVREGRLMWWQGGAAPERQVPGRNTPFRIGSLTKLFTAAVLLELRDRGAVDLDRPVEAYVPAARRLRYPTTDSARVTLRSLLSHTSGLPSASPSGNGTGEAPPSAALQEMQLLFAPGTDVQYSNFGYELIGEIIEHLGGAPYPKLLEERILGRLGMTATRFPLAGEGPPGGPPWTALGSANSAGGLVSTLDDLVRFVSFELGAWPPRDGEDTGPLPRRVVRESQLALGGQRTDRPEFGAGWILSQLGTLRFVSLTGKVDGYSATLALFPDRGMGTIVLATSVATSSEPLALGLLEAAAADLEEQAHVDDSLVRAALDTVLQVLAGVPPARVSERFAPGFFERVPGFESVVSRIQVTRGRCSTVKSITLRSVSAGEAILSCDHGELSVAIDVTTTGRGQISRLVFH